MISMDVKQAYNIWADQYDSNSNKTRDLEAISLRAILPDIKFDNCLEIGCGTGKNTEYLIKKAKQVTAVDLSNEMLAKARQKINTDNVQFIQTDIKNDWTFVTKQYDLVTFSLVLEHIENLNDIFKKVSNVIRSNGYVYIGELHPFKQYTGTKARFDTEAGQQIVTCFNHNISDFTLSAKQNGFEIIDIAEYFDENDKTIIPRIIALLLRKK
ncbi:MAG TPA: class I SAM-dependent methyltransferase [Chitinophagaceae bacterium]|nr:class I SAM-dependent methyltransferase [Chitinophagaceae bacterium]